MKINPEPDKAQRPMRLPRTSQNQATSKSWRIDRALLFIGIALSGLASAFAETYTLAPINPPAGSESFTVAGLNNLGQVVGTANVRIDRTHAKNVPFVWATNSAVSLPSAASAHATGISDTGMIVGDATGVGAVWWKIGPSGGYEMGNWNDLLPAGSPLQLDQVWAISPDGQFVVFDAFNAETGLLGVAIARVEPGEITTWTIPTVGNPPIPLSDSVANDIDHDGVTVRLVGSYSLDADYHSHAFLWQKDLATGAVTMIDLDEVTRSSIPQGVNSSGEVAGNIYLSSVSSSHAFFWNASGIKYELPTLGGPTNYASSLSDGGYVTGSSERPGKNATQHAFIWSLGTGMRDLNLLKSPTDTSGLELTSAMKINRAGQILAHGVRKNVAGNVLLTRVP